MGVDGRWCARWSSKPVEAVNSCFGGFDSHIFPPKLQKPRSLRGFCLSKRERLTEGRQAADRTALESNQIIFFVDKQTSGYYIICRTEYCSKAILRWGNGSQGYLVAYDKLATSSLLQRTEACRCGVCMRLEQEETFVGAFLFSQVAPNRPGRRGIAMFVLNAIGNFTHSNHVSGY